MRAPLSFLALARWLLVAYTASMVWVFILALTRISLFNVKGTLATTF